VTSRVAAWPVTREAYLDQRERAEEWGKRVFGLVVAAGGGALQSDVTARWRFTDETGGPDFASVAHPECTMTVLIVEAEVTDDGQDASQAEPRG
jgi:hypothetical protein